MSLRYSADFWRSRLVSLLKDFAFIVSSHTVPKNTKDPLCSQNALFVLKIKGCKKQKKKSNGPGKTKWGDPFVFPLGLQA